MTTKIFTPQRGRYIAREFTDADWKTYLESCCHTTDYKLVLDKCTLTDNFKNLYISVVMDAKVDLERRLAMYLAMEGESLQFGSSALACLFKDRDFLHAVFAVRSPDEQLCLLNRGLIQRAIELDSNRALRKSSAFLELMEAVNYEVRVKAVWYLSFSCFIGSDSYPQQMKNLILKLPKDQQLQAFYLLTDDPNSPGLHRIREVPNFFGYILKLMSPEQRLQALLSQDVDNTRVIAKCLCSDQIMRDIFSLLTNEQRVILFDARSDSGEPAFIAVLLYYPSVIQLMLEHHTPEEIIYLCTQTRSLYCSNSVIISCVTQYMSDEGVKNNIELILRGLPYRKRLKLLDRRDQDGVNLYEAVPSTSKAVDRYKRLIASLISESEESRCIVEKYRAILNQVDLSHFKIKNNVDLLRACYHVDLGITLAYFSEIAKEGYDTLKIKFISMISERYANESHSFFPFTGSPNSLTNQFCYEQICLCFNPQTLADLVSCFMGNHGHTLSQWLIEVPETFPEALSYKDKIAFFRHSAPIVRLTTNDPSLAHYPATLKALSTLAFDGHTIINMNDISRYSFKRHCKLYEYLNNKLPNVAKTIYQHNRHWRSLAEDIQTVLRSGQTPREAILALIQGLKQGGQAYTGNEGESGHEANVAIWKFLSYYQRLPPALKDELDALEDAHHNKVILQFTEKLKNYSCVEQLSLSLERVIEHNDHLSFLDENPGISTEFLEQVEKRCRAGIEVEKEESVLNIPIPDWIAELIVKHMHLDNLDQKIHKLGSIPNCFMDAFFHYVNLNNPEVFFMGLKDAFDSNFFSKEKRVVILAALANHSKRNVFSPYVNDLEIAQDNEHTPLLHR